MSIIILLSQVFILLKIAYQDLRSQLVDLYLLILLPVTFLIQITTNDLVLTQAELSSKTIVVLVIVFITMAFVGLKVNIKKAIGKADVIFLLSILVVLPIYEFLFVLIISGVSGVLHGLYLRKFKSLRTIPFCTHLSLTMLLYLLLQRLNPIFLQLY